MPDCCLKQRAVGTYVCTIRMYVHTYIRMYAIQCVRTVCGDVVCTYVCIPSSFTSTYIRTYVYSTVCTAQEYASVHMCVHAHVRMYCMYVCVYIQCLQYMSSYSNVYRGNHLRSCCISPLEPSRGWVCLVRTTSLEYWQRTVSNDLLSTCSVSSCGRTVEHWLVDI